MKINFTKVATFLSVAVLILSSFKNVETDINWIENLKSKYTNKDEFINYWYNSVAMKNYETVKHIPQEAIIAKLWLETQGGMSGAGRRGAIFGIKGDGITGYDNVDGESVEYQAYGSTWQALSHFCDLINNEPELLKTGIDKIDRDLYYNRYLAWQKVNPSNKDWENWLLALQIDPQRNKSKLSYANCGCKDGSTKFCYNKRKKHAQKGINWIKQNLPPAEE